MTERERLIELIGSKVCEDYSPNCDEWQPHSCEKCYANDCRIGELADYLLANGVIVPPCKVGDTVYEICERRRSGKWQKVIVERVVHGIEIGIDKILLARCGTTTYVYLSRLGKTVFLTKEEAEQALKGGEQE